MQRKFIPGSEWLYFKIYTGTKTADLLLTHQISAFVNNLIESGVIDKFFFIRYSDLDFHIRLRLHLSDPDNYGRVFSDFHSYFSKCVGNGSVSKIMCDTYVREIERYGAETMEVSEDIFFVDSVAILTILKAIREYGNEPDLENRMFALLFIDHFFDVFGYSLRGRIEIMGNIANNFKKEFGFTSNSYTRQLNYKYRLHRKGIADALEGRNEFAMQHDVIFVIRKTGLMDKASRINATIKDEATKRSLLTSYIHMTMNRLFRSKNRIYELVLYDFLLRYYTSKEAKEKYH